MIRSAECQGGNTHQRKHPSVAIQTCVRPTQDLISQAADVVGQRHSSVPGRQPASSRMA